MNISCMRVSPWIYDRILRPKIISRWNIENNIRHFFDPSNKSILDFGCGTGNNCFIFCPSDYLGIDIDKDRIEYARKRHPDYKFKDVSEDLIEIEDSSFDVIFICGVLHHLPDSRIKRYNKHFSRILKQNGILLIFEAYLAPHSIMRNWIMKKFDDGKHIRNEEQYCQLFEKNFDSRVIKKFKTIHFYNAILFTATKRKTFCALH